MTRGDEPNSVPAADFIYHGVTGNYPAEFCFKSWDCIPVEEEESHAKYDLYLIPK